MRRLTFAAAAVVALVATSYAVAHGIDGAKSATAVAAQFTATNPTTSSRTCTTSNGKTIVVTDGKYTGATTNASTPDLAGNITIRARSIVNVTDNVGVVNGVFRIDVANGKDTEAAFSAVTSGTALAGYAAGKAHQPNARLLGNVSATFDPKTGFTGGKIGGGTSGGNAVELSAGACNPQGSASEGHSSARGPIQTLNSTTIVVAGLQCTIPTAQSAEINSKFKQGDRVEIQCALANGTNTLTRISKRD
jgi:hypothetical protein